MLFGFALPTLEESNKQRRAFNFWGKSDPILESVHQLDYKIPSIGPHDLQLYKNDSTYKVQEKSFKIKNSKDEEKMRASYL